MPSHDEALEVVGQLRRYLEDLTVFEGRTFISPKGIESAVSTATPTATSVTGALEGFRQEICECMACPLGKSRTRFVFGAGRPDADLMFIGEAPGADEDQQGEPFVGAAGQLLTKIIEAMQLSRDQVYICNILKCRPPNNRDPQAAEIETCEPYLQRQIELIQPRIICTLGRIAAQVLLRTQTSMGKLRGTLHSYQGIPVIATYHPAALLRNPQWKRPTWEDMKWLRREYDGVEL
jgi:uracil-DNA glycosylase family 4